MVKNAKEADQASHKSLTHMKNNKNMSLNVNFPLLCTYYTILSLFEKWRTYLIFPLFGNIMALNPIFSCTCVFSGCLFHFCIHCDKFLVFTRVLTTLLRSQKWNVINNHQKLLNGLKRSPNIHRPHNVRS